MGRVSMLDGVRASRMWRGRPRLPVMLLFGLVALGLVGSIMLIFATIQNERADRAQIARMNEVMTSLRDINRAVINAETGQRGYFITLDRRYLAPFTAAKASYQPALVRLEALVGDAPLPRQRDLLVDIRQLSRAKFAEMEETIALTEQGNLAEAHRRILTDEGQDLMERLRRAVTSMEAVEQAQMQSLRAQTERGEARLVPMLLFLLLLIIVSLALGLWQVLHSAGAEAQAAQAPALEAARDRADLLARELNHRVKNLFAVVLAIVRMSGRDTPEAAPAIARIADRIEALLKAHDVTQGAAQHRVAKLQELVETAIAPYRSEQNQCEISGPPVLLPEAQVVPLGLVLHELVTNAVKYGAWMQPGGKIEVQWSIDQATPPGLTLRWQEYCSVPCPEPDDKQGFGSLLVQSAARQLQGNFERNHSAAGMSLRLEFPLAESH
ncbi:MAG TPA: CHASE3 domain-containing protein [Novosphingobium sp.]|nr:CHASE3 domain-containing protein [Novosphingobium sp.]